MALQLRSETEWETFFHTTAGIPETQSKAYAKIFSDNRMNETILSELTKDNLQDLEITAIGDILSILKHSKTETTTNTRVVPSSIGKPPKLPQLTNEMTLPQFRKFKIDWTVFKNITLLPDNQITSQLYNACEDSVQTSLINTIPNFIELPGGGTAENHRVYRYSTIEPNSTSYDICKFISGHTRDNSRRCYSPQIACSRL